MKKIIFILLISAAFGLTSCTSTLHVTSVEKFNENFDAVKTALSQQGYEYSRVDSDRKKNVDVKSSSNATVITEDEIVNSVYTFSNAEGDELNIMLKTRERYSKYCDCNFYGSVELTGCKTSKTADYKKLCGDYSVVKLKLANMEQDKDVKVYNSRKTKDLHWAIIFLPVVATICYSWLSFYK